MNKIMKIMDIVQIKAVHRLLFEEKNKQNFLQIFFPKPKKKG